MWVRTIKQTLSTKKRDVSMYHQADIEYQYYDNDEDRRVQAAVKTEMLNLLAVGLMISS